MNLTPLLLELFALVFIFSGLMFYAGIKYSQFKLVGYNDNTPSIFTTLLAQKQNKKDGLKIIEINDIKITKDNKIVIKNTNDKKTKTNAVKLPITPRMTIYKTIDED